MDLLWEILWDLRISSGSFADIRAGALRRKPRGSVLCTLHSKCQLINCRRYRINCLNPIQLRGRKSPPFFHFYDSRAFPAIIFISWKTEAVGDIIRPRKLSLKHNCLAKLLFFVYMSIFTLGLLQVVGCFT